MCVFCWNLLKDFMLELMVFNVCVLLEFVGRLYAEIDGFQCVLCWNLLKDYMLELMVSMCVFCWNLLNAGIYGFQCVYSAGIC